MGRVQDLSKSNLCRLFSGCHCSLTASQSLCVTRSSSSAMPCMWKSNVKCFLGHINMPYPLSFHALRRRGFSFSLHPPRPNGGHSFATTISAVCTNFCIRHGTGHPTSEEVAPPMIYACIYYIHAYICAGI